MMAGRLVIVAATLVALSSCTNEIGGNVTSDSAAGQRSSVTPSTNPASVTTSSVARLLPPRSRNLDLTGVDPCTDVLTRDQLHELAYDLGYQRRPQPNTSGIHGGPTCSYSSTRPPDQPSRDIGVLIGVSTSEGADAWLTDPGRKSSADLAHQTTVADFPELVLPNPNFVDNCAVVVDVHDGQYLEVSGNPSGGAKGSSPDPYCAEAQRVAEMVIRTLSARR